MEVPSRELKVLLSKASNLHAKAVHDDCRAYCVINCGKRQYCTPTLSSLSPTWDFQATL